MLIWTTCFRVFLWRNTMIYIQLTQIILANCIKLVRFRNHPILKWLYGINGFRCFRFITGLCIQSFLFAMNKLLKSPRFTLLTCLITHFFMISFTSISNNSDVLLLLPIGKEYLIEKFSFERVLHNRLLNPQYQNPF